MMTILYSYKNLLFREDLMIKKLVIGSLLAVCFVTNASALNTYGKCKKSHKKFEKNAYAYGCKLARDGKDIEKKCVDRYSQDVDNRATNLFAKGGMGYGFLEESCIAGGEWYESHE
jgi:hypothetical protein